MASAPNMKVRATMDNSDLKKKSQESKAALRDFEKTGTDAVSKLGEAFGVNTGKIGQMMSSIRGLGVTMQESGNKGVAAFGSMLAGVNGLAAGIAGLGLGAALATFKALSSEAENFKNTVAGANMELATQAYIDTYRQFIHDVNREFGEGAANAQSDWKKFWSTLGADFRAMFGTGSFALMASEGYVGGSDQVLNNYSDAVSGATDAAAEAERIVNEIFDVQRQISDASVEWARMEAQIAEYKRIAYDKTASLAEQQAAIAAAAELTNKRYGEAADLRGQLADLQEELNGLTESSVADIDKANQLRIQAERITIALNNALRELGERQASINAEVAKEVQLRRQTAAFIQQKEGYAADTSEARAALTTFTASLETPQLEMNFPKLEVPVVPVLDTEAVIDLSQQLESVLTGTLENIGAGIGNLIGDLATGGDAWGNFADMAISTFGDMAITIGKMAVSTGVATLGIKAALESLNGYVAIAAGVALIALGSAVKAGLSNVAAGNYNASTNVASATGNYGAGSSPINTAFENREMTIKVTGTLRAEGSQLVSVIENERTRLAHTT